MCAWENLNFHGNLKTIGHLRKDEFILIVQKKRVRRLRKQAPPTHTPATIARQLVDDARNMKGTPYFKIMIEGSTGIYYASPTYGHRDYNKSRLFDKTPRNTQIMELFNKLVTR